MASIKTTTWVGKNVSFVFVLYAKQFVLMMSKQFFHSLSARIAYYYKRPKYENIFSFNGGVILMVPSTK